MVAQAAAESATDEHQKIFESVGVLATRIENTRWQSQLMWPRVFGVGNRAEVWGKLVKRWDTAVAGRNRELLKTVLVPERCRIEDLAGVIRSVCASTNDDKMEKEKRPIDNRLVLNKKTLNAHEAQRKGTAGIIDSRIGVRFQERCSSSLECKGTDANNAWVSMGS